MKPPPERDDAPRGRGDGAQSKPIEDTPIVPQTAPWDNVPEELKTRVAWVCWRYEERDGKPTKVPKNPRTGRNAKSNDARTWATFADAVAAAPRYDGVGIMFSEGLCGVDLDHCRDPTTGELEAWAAKVVAELDSYTEASPSGTGVHVLATGDLPPGRRRKGAVEIYGPGSPRYFTVTGAHLPGTPTTVNERTDALASVHGRLIGTEAPQADAPSKPTEPLHLADEDLLAVARSATNGADFSRLWEGGWPEDDSAGDLALCSHLAFWCGGDAARVDALFRRSGRYRQKWERVDYRERTIGKALEGMTEFYTPHKQEAQTEKSAAVTALLVEVQQNPAAVWEAVPILATLPRAKLQATRAALKAELGGALNLNNFDAAIREAREEARNARRATLRTDEGRPVVLLGRQLRDTSRDAMQALLQANVPPQLFVRAAKLARVVRDEKGRPVIGDVGVDELRNLLKTAANFVRFTKSGEVDCDPPEVIARDILAEGEWVFPGLEGVVEVPTLRPNGSVLSAPGYDPETMLFFAPPADAGATPKVPAAPTGEDVLAAVALLEELTCDFPFTSEADRANFVGLLLTPFVRPAIDGCVPLAIIDAPQAGTGKSLLAEVVALLGTGRKAALLAAPRDDDEMRKRLTAILRAGTTFVVFDNVEVPLEFPSLALALTAHVWQDRVLGMSDNVILPQRATWAVTGNNVTLRGDMPRRTYVIHLDAEQARPWLRNTDAFRHPDLLKWVSANRGPLVGALLTLARAWFAAGKPDTTAPVIGGFAEWSRTVGGILSNAGIPGFLGNLNELYDAMDDEGQQWRAFLEAWEECFGQTAVTTAELVAGMVSDTGPTTLREALPDAAFDRNGMPDPRRLGHLLKRKDRVRVGDPPRWIAKTRALHKVAQWVLRHD